MLGPMDRLLTTALAAAAALLVALPVTVTAQMPDLRLPISLDADSTSLDVKNQIVKFEGLRLSQGTIGIVADEGQATKLDFNESVWKLSGNVVLDFANGHVECDAADLHFNDYELTLATVDGSPATFELRRDDSDETTYAEARSLRYNLADGTVEFSGDARIVEAGNQISSSYLVYDINAQRISAQSSDDGSNRVRVEYRPPDETGDAGDPPADAGGGDAPP